MRRAALLSAFALLLVVAWVRSQSLGFDLQATTARIAALHRSLPPEPGAFPVEWIAGNDCDNDPAMQVHAYNDDLYIIRQSKCEIYEAPFMYLIFGDERVLLMDTGAKGILPVRSVVEHIVAEWLARNGRDSIDLVVAHTHGHFDHIQSDSQFGHVPGITFVPWQAASALPFWGFTDYPNDQPVIDLGNRKIDVLGTPGHHPVSVTLYDRRTRLLLTGDIVYPGHLFVFSPNDWSQFVTSLQRLVTFAATHPVRWVVGCHIETSTTPFEPYGYGALVHPDEHELQFAPTILAEILDASLGMGGSPQCEIFGEFVIHPVYLCGIGWNG